MAVSLALFLLGHVPRHHPLIPALHFTIPLVQHKSSLPAPVRMGGPRVARVGSTITWTGTLPTNWRGTVILKGRWRFGRWHVLAVTDASNGFYELRLRLKRRGVLRLRLLGLRGLFAVGSIQVV